MELLLKQCSKCDSENSLRGVIFAPSVPFEDDLSPTPEDAQGHIFCTNCDHHEMQKATDILQQINDRTLSPLLEGETYPPKPAPLL